MLNGYTYLCLEITKRGSNKKNETEEGFEFAGDSVSVQCVGFLYP